MSKWKNNPFIAFALSFLFPGFGMYYLKRWGKGTLNIGIVILLGLALMRMENVPIVITALIGIASGAWAYLEADAIGKHDAS